MATDIVQAARRCYIATGISKTGMQDIAESAGIARSTLYRYFPKRDDVLVATVRHEMEAVNKKLQRQLSDYQEPADIIVEGLVLALREIPRRPILKAVFASDEDARARRTIWNSSAIVGFGEELMANVILPAQRAGLLQDTVNPAIMVEWVYRVLLSLLTLPSNWNRDEASLRVTLHALLVPVLLR